MFSPRLSRQSEKPLNTFSHATPAHAACTNETEIQQNKSAREIHTACFPSKGGNFLQFETPQIN